MTNPMRGLSASLLTMDLHGCFRKRFDEYLPPNTIFGTSVDVKGDYLVVGAPNYGTVGRAFVYFKNGSDWQYLMDIANPVGTDGDNFAGAVAISDNAIAIGTSGYSQDSLHCGSVFTYVKISGSFFFRNS